MNTKDPLRLLANADIGYGGVIGRLRIAVLVLDLDAGWAPLPLRAAPAPSSRTTAPQPSS
jgi:hypothetical protein